LLLRDALRPAEEEGEGDAALGARAIASASSKNHAPLSELGAGAAIDYSTEDIAARWNRPPKPASTRSRTSPVAPLFPAHSPRSRNTEGCHRSSSWKATDTTYRNWRRRVYGRTAAAAGLDAARPYYLRHLFCSFLLAEGASVVEVARQAGHSPAMTLSTYGHVIEELEGAEKRSAEAAVRAARDAARPLGVLAGELRSLN
jgi:integrase